MRLSPALDAALDLPCGCRAGDNPRLCAYHQGWRDGFDAAPKYSPPRGARVVPTTTAPPRQRTATRS